MTKFHEAPCQRPPRTIVIIRLRYVVTEPPREPPSGHVEVVAQPRGERDVPAVPEVLEVLRDVGRVEVLRELVAEEGALPSATSV